MMNRVTVAGLRLRPSSVALPLQQLARCPSSSTTACPYHARRYATQPGSAPESRRRAVTPFNDDGNVPWTQLSAGEKTARAAQQTFNFGMVVVGLVLTVRLLTGT